MKQSKIIILGFDSVANRIFSKRSHSHKIKCQMDTFHEVLPGNSVFSNFYYIGTKEIRYLNQSIEFSIKSYINMEILSSSIQTLYKISRDQAVCRPARKKIPPKKIQRKTRICFSGIDDFEEFTLKCGCKTKTSQM